MTLPANFDEWEHLQDQVRRWHNKRVDLWFKNQPNNDVSTPKSSLKHACKIKDEDTVPIVILRKLLFDFDAGYAQSVQAPIYGMPLDELQASVRFVPQVNLHFKERHPYIADRTRAVTGRISFRLKGESSETYSRAKAEALASKIKGAFTGPIFVWRKGKYYYYYRDNSSGIDLRILCPSKSEGRRVASAVLDVANIPFNDDFEDFVENTRSYPNNPGNQIVYGQSQPKPIRRPTVDVRFRYAQLLLHGQRRHINLVATAEVGLRRVIQKVNQA
ncbi:MAG: hypothetical protein F6K62_18925 [Sphaerospermopsis sp. SIO1G2]|nr:hypothetical protein [Sphaerospermopsis sp. SIO1G2]